MQDHKKEQYLTYMMGTIINVLQNNPSSVSLDWNLYTITVAWFKIWYSNNI